MRLLDADALIYDNEAHLAEFIDERSLPKYAILSHTWEKGEVLFNDIALGPQHEIEIRVPRTGSPSTSSPDGSSVSSEEDATDSELSSDQSDDEEASEAKSLSARDSSPSEPRTEEASVYNGQPPARYRISHHDKAGWNKILNTCLQACRDGFQYVWIDTCCIDKSSSAELSEAIDSMYRWYSLATVCYVYLGDCTRCPKLNICSISKNLGDLEALLAAPTPSQDWPENWVTYDEWLWTGRSNAVSIDEFGEAVTRIAPFAYHNAAERLRRYIALEGEPETARSKRVPLHYLPAVKQKRAAVEPSPGQFESLIELFFGEMHGVHPHGEEVGDSKEVMTGTDPGSKVAASALKNLIDFVFAQGELQLFNTCTTQSFEQSRWFSRGWTLQELIASHQLHFFDKAWQHIGKKSHMLNTLVSVTRNHAEALQNDIDRFSIAQRMSWASGRRTTRLEDQAYSLLGIFNINLPLLYGEGIRAFQRLQEEIVRVSTDYSIFAWGNGSATSNLRDIGPEILCNHVFAPSVECFGGHSRDIISRPTGGPEVQLTNEGVRLKLSLDPRRQKHGYDVSIAYLNCLVKHPSGRRHIGLRLRNTQSTRLWEKSEANELMRTRVEVEADFTLPGPQRPRRLLFVDEITHDLEAEYERPQEVLIARDGGTLGALPITPAIKVDVQLPAQRSSGRSWRVAAAYPTSQWCHTSSILSLPRHGRVANCAIAISNSDGETYIIVVGTPIAIDQNFDASRFSSWIFGARTAPSAGFEEDSPNVLRPCPSSKPDWVNHGQPFPTLKAQLRNASLQVELFARKDFFERSNGRCEGYKSIKLFDGANLRTCIYPWSKDTDQERCALKIVYEGIPELELIAREAEKVPHTA